MLGMLHHYRRKLIGIRENVERPTTLSRGATALPQCEVPLTDQITNLMRSLPPAQRDRPWSVSELVARLNGRFKARPSCGDVGIALRRLGWTRATDWLQSGGGRRVCIREASP
jgi:hypothetical protein